jgi:hypothetical protein
LRVAAGFRFPAILIAHLVAMEIAAREHEKKTSR